VRFAHICFVNCKIISAITPFGDSEVQSLRL